MIFVNLRAVTYILFLTQIRRQKKISWPCIITVFPLRPDPSENCLLTVRLRESVVMNQFYGRTEASRGAEQLL
jgi:hypothetical protein